MTTIPIRPLACICRKQYSTFYASQEQNWKRLMVTPMLRSIFDFQISPIVIRWVFVFMMNFLGR